MASTACLVMSPSTTAMRVGFMRQLKPEGSGPVESGVVTAARIWISGLRFGGAPEQLALWYGFRTGAIGVVLRFGGLAAAQPQAGADRRGRRRGGRGRRLGHDLHREPEGSERQRGALRNSRADESRHPAAAGPRGR